jgi:CRISPR system Cascade subunit CasE
MMYFSRATIAPGVDANKLAQLSCADGYHAHQQVWQFFGDAPNATRDFLFRREQQQGWPVYYLVSSRQPVDKTGVWTIQSKHYQPRLGTGQKLAFRLRANPVVTHTDENGKQQRHDVVMNLKKQLADQASGEREVIEQAGLQWLQRKSHLNGFEVMPEIRIDGYLQHRLSRPKQQKMIQFSSLDYDGILTVSDPDKLTSMLFQGVGRAKAFGCGLMLVRRI